MGFPPSKLVTSKYLPVTHIIFDLDGTLMDTESILNDLIRDILQRYDIEYTEDIMYKMLGTQTPMKAQILVNDLKLPISPEELDAEIENVGNERMSDVKLLPGAERLLRHLQKYSIPMGIASSSGRPGYDIKVSQYPALFSHMNPVVTGATDPELKNGKPAPDIFLLCASRFPEAPAAEKCLVFEDSPNGVKGAVAAGMQVVMIPDELTKNAAMLHPTVILKSLNDFVPEDFGLPRFNQ